MENFKQAAIIDRSIISKSDINTIKSWIISFMGENTEIIQQRFNQGFFKECHGDIHLENICLMNNKIYIFDCIEFNERFRFCDTASDLAFLLMDLDFHNRHDLSERVFKSYKKITNDFIDDNLIIFYKIYRAFVRGKVESLKSRASCKSPNRSFPKRFWSGIHFLMVEKSGSPTEAFGGDNLFVIGSYVLLWMR